MSGAVTGVTGTLTNAGYNRTDMSFLWIGGLLGVAAIGYWIWSQYRVPWQVHSLLKVATLKELQPIDVEPDGPNPFGYKTMWVAMRAHNPLLVAKALGLESRHPSNWSSGLPAAYRGWVFVTPPIEGWVLATSRDFPSIYPHDTSDPGAGSWVAELASQFDEVQYFQTHRVVESHVWYRFQQGVCVRAYAYLGESGETLINFGENTPEEDELGFDFVDDANELEEDDWGATPPPVPSEEEVMVLADLWSVSPAHLEPGGPGRGVGIIGLFPEVEEGRVAGQDQWEL